MAFQIGQPGVSAFLQSLLSHLDVVIQMGDHHFLPVNTELNVMKNLLLGFEDVLLDGERKRQHGSKSANRWMDQLNDSLYDIDDLVDEIKMEKQQLQPRATGQPSNNKVPYDFSVGFHISKNIKNRLDLVVGILRIHTEEAKRLKLKRDAVQHDAIWLASQAKIRPKQGCFADEALIHGREDDKNEIIEMLLREDSGESERKRKRKYEVVCVVGMGGLGKTTLAQQVFHDERVMNTFAARSWTCVSDVFDVIKVIQNLIESAAENAKKSDRAAIMPSGLPALQARLKEIINDQKFLIVLDDVWTANVLKELIGPLHFGAKGSKILVTTRLGKVAEDLGNKEPYRLGQLEHAHCLKIFNDNAFGDEDGIDSDEDLMKMGEEIVKKCEGVPLVAKVIGSLLNGEDEGKWKAVKDNDLWDLAYKDEDLHPGLRLSYFYLPPILKRCFEYFALFRSDLIFDRKELVRMWMAEGLIEEKEGKEPEEIGDQYYNDLKGRSLIQENDTMHDMVHHLASTVCGSSFFRFSSGFCSSTSSLQSVRHVFIEEELELLIDSRKLRTLKYEGYLCEELFSYKWCRNLKVSASTQYCLPSLPTSLGCDLKHLRYLKLSGQFLNSTLPDSICMLTNLQVLDLSFCRNLKNLPQYLGKLSNLRFLILDSTGIIGLPDSVCCLSNLRVLDLSSCESLTALPNAVNLPSLRELMVDGSSISSLPESIVNATNLRVLQILDFGITLPANIGKLTKLEELSCYWVGKEKGRGIDELQGMNRLGGSLRIDNMENIESAEEALMANLRSKKHIKALEFVWKEFDTALTGRDGEMEVRVMEALEPNAAITLLSLENYVGHMLPSWMWTAPLHNLTYLCLTNLPEMTEMTGMDFKSLRIFQLLNCPSLEEVNMTTPKLESLVVERCEELKPEKLVLPLLWDALKSLKCDYGHLDHFVQQLKSTNASPCTKLKYLAIRVGGDDGITSLPVGWPSIFTSLEHLTLTVLPPIDFQIVSEENESCSVAQSEMLSIRKLTIWYCPGLFSLESLILPPSLEELCIGDCPDLRNLPYELGGLNSLKEIHFQDCPVLEIRPYHPLPLSITRKTIVNCRKLAEQRVMEEREEWKGAFGLIDAIWRRPGE